MAPLVTAIEFGAALLLDYRLRFAATAGPASHPWKASLALFAGLHLFLLVGRFTYSPTDASADSSQVGGCRTACPVD